MSHPVMPGATFTIAWDIVVVIVTIIISLVYSYLVGGVYTLVGLLV